MEIADNYGKIPPQDIDAEIAILGAILLEKNAIERVVSRLRPEYFYSESNSIIYACMLDLYEDGKNIDQLTLMDKLRSVDNLDKIGGPVYIGELTSRIATAQAIEDHYNIIKEKYIKRQQIRVGMEMCEDGFNGSVSADNSMSKIDIKLNELYGVINDEISSMSMLSAVEKTLDEIEERKRRAMDGRLPGIPTGLSFIDDYTTGWHPGKLIIIAGRPSDGKTALALNSAAEAAENNLNVCMFSIEMDEVDLTERLINRELNGSVYSECIRHGNLKDEDMEKIHAAAGRVSGYPIYIHHHAEMDSSYIKNVAREYHRQGKCDMIIIDYLQLMHFTGTNRNNDIGKATSSLKALAMELRIPIILLSQLSRDGVGRPQLHNLRDSGNIEQDADIVIFIWRSPDKMQRFIAIDKHRGGLISQGDTRIYNNETVTRFDMDPILLERNS